MQHTFGVLEFVPAHVKARRVLIHNALDRKTVLGARVAVCPAPHITGSGGGISVALTHSFSLNTLAGVDVCRLRLRQ